MMQYVALVTLILLAQYLAFSLLCGAARAKSGIKAPAVTGDEGFERAYRVQMNTLEQLLVCLPALWLSGSYFMPSVAAVLGMIFFLGRLMYRFSYIRDPASRGPGMMTGFAALLGLLLTAFWGVISTIA